MWILLATVCLTPDVNSCSTLVWKKETFTTEKQCAETAIVQIPALNDYYFVNPRCVELPGKSA